MVPSMLVTASPLTTTDLLNCPTLANSTPQQVHDSINETDDKSHIPTPIKIAPKHHVIDTYS